MPSVFVLGMSVLDFVFDVDAFPAQAEKYRANNAVIVGGGCAANAAVAIAKLGGKAHLSARLGDDHIAQLILDELAEAGVATSGCHKAPGGRSSFSSVLVDKDGERQIVNFRGSGLTTTTDWMNINADSVLVDTRWPEGAQAALQKARQLGVPGIVDAEAPVNEHAILAASHVAFSRQGLTEFTGTDDISSGLEMADQKLSGDVCVTDGSNGSFMLQSGDLVHVAGFKVDVVDTLGAGDVWHGAFALRLAEGAEIRDAMRFANATAALKCTRFGGRAGCPSREAVDAFMKENE